jgi:hypothetical protein
VSWGVYSGSWQPGHLDANRCERFDVAGVEGSSRALQIDSEIVDRRVGERVRRGNDSQEQVLGADVPVAASLRLADRVGHHGPRVVREPFEHALPPVLLVSGLSGDPECVTDLLPRPASGAGSLYLLAFELVGQASQRHHRTQASGGLDVGCGSSNGCEVHAVILV